MKYGWDFQFAYNNPPFCCFFQCFFYVFSNALRLVPIFVYFNICVLFYHICLSLVFSPADSGLFFFVQIRLTFYWLLPIDSEYVCKVWQQAVTSQFFVCRVIKFCVIDLINQKQAKWMANNTFSFFCCEYSRHLWLGLLYVGYTRRFIWFYRSAATIPKQLLWSVSYEV